MQRTFVDLKGVSEESWISPRVGAGVSPAEGQWLRAAYIESAEPVLSQTLSPIATVGLIPNDLPAGGQTETLALRWDAEWTPHFFTSVEYQRQSAHDLSVPILNTVENFEHRQGAYRLGRGDRQSVARLRHRCLRHGGRRARRKSGRTRASGSRCPSFPTGSPGPGSPSCTRAA